MEKAFKFKYYFITLCEVDVRSYHNPCLVFKSRYCVTKGIRCSVWIRLCGHPYNLNSHNVLLEAVYDLWA